MIPPGSAISNTSSFGRNPSEVANIRSGRLPERDRHDPATLRKLLARAQEERHAGPAPVLDLDLERDERLGVGVGRDAVLLPVALVLAAHDAGRVERLHRLEDLQLLGSQGLRLERRGRFHRDEAERLEEVCHDHVAERPGALVEAGAASDRERLGHVDLDVVDVIAVPDRLEQTVREPQREDVLHGLLAEEVVDSEDLRLVEDAVNRVVQSTSGLEVGPERLFENDARALREPVLAQGLGDAGKGLRRYGKVVEQAWLAADLPLCRGDGVSEAARVRGVGGGVVEALREPGPGLLGRRAAAELVDCRAGVCPELLVRQGLPRGADDPVALGKEAGFGEMEEPRHELSPREVTGRSEEDDDVILGRREGVGAGAGGLGHGAHHRRPHSR